jgi:protein-S-isoprenylcysteine O-methyltransferase Ste14
MSRGVVGLALEIVFFVLAFGARSYVQWRRTGSTGFIRPRRGAPLVETIASSLFVVAILLLAVGPVADLLGATRFAALDSSAVAVIGFVIAATGIALTIAAQLSMGDSWRIGVDPSERTELVTDGIFGTVRNPIFTAMVLAAVGLALLVPNWWSFAAVVVLVVGLELQVRRVEEPHLRSAHGASYEQYRHRTGRFVPGIGRTRPVSRSAA